MLEGQSSWCMGLHWAGRATAPQALRADWLALAKDSPNAGMEPKPREGPTNLRSGLRGRPGAGQPA